MALTLKEGHWINFCGLHLVITQDLRSAVLADVIIALIATVNWVSFTSEDAFSVAAAVTIVPTLGPRFGQTFEYVLF